MEVSFGYGVGSRGRRAMPWAVCSVSQCAVCVLVSSC